MHVREFFTFKYVVLIGVLLAGIVLLAFVLRPVRNWVLNFLRKIGNRSKTKDESSTEAETVSTFNFQHLKGEITEVKDNINLLLDRLSGVHSVLNGIQRDLYELRELLKSRSRREALDNFTHSAARTTSNQPSNLPATAANDLTIAHPSSPTYPHSEVTALYNIARNDQVQRERFREHHRPFFINVTNDIERRREGTVAADFRTASNGSYLAIRGRLGDTLVFPDFTLVIVEAVYGPGALGDVFECPKYDGQFSYPNIEVVEPAVFKQSGTDSWVIDKKGLLELGSPQGT